MKIVRKVTALIMVFALATTVFAYSGDGQTVSVRESANANNATVAWDGYNNSVIITRADGSIYVLIVGESGSVNDNGTIFAPVDVMEQIFAVVEPTPEEPTPEETPEATTPRTHDIHGGLHRIEHAGSVAYLFGSLHGGLDDWFPLADIVEDAMLRADIFAFEIDFSIDEEEVSAIFESIMTIPDGQTITDILSEELYEHYIATMEDWANYFMGIMDDIYYTNPAFLIFSLQQAVLAIMAEIDVQGDGGITVDDYVMDFAVENERYVIGLMDFETQQRVVLAPPQEIMEYMIAYFRPFLETVEEMRDGEIDNFNQLVYYYVTNNAEGLVREMHQDFDIEEEHPVDRYFRYVVLNARSTLFAAELVRHLAGPAFTSTIQQLELLGIEVLPVY